MKFLNRSFIFLSSFLWISSLFILSFFSLSFFPSFTFIFVLSPVPYSQLTVCAKWTYNVHYYRTYKEQESQKHVTTSCSGTKPFYQLWVKGFDVRRRDTIFYAVLFIWPPTRAAPHRAQTRLAPASSKIDPSRLASKTQLLFSSKFSHKLPRASGAWRHAHLVTQYRLGLLWHLSDTSIRSRAPALTPAPILHPNNPCAEPKGSQPN